MRALDNVVVTDLKPGDVLDTNRATVVRTTLVEPDAILVVLKTSGGETCAPVWRRDLRQYIWRTL